MIRQAVLALTFLSLANCTSIPITSLPKLAGLRPDTADFMQFQLAVRVQDDFRFYADGVKLSFEIASDEKTGQPPVKLALTFVPVEGELPRFLQRQAKRGYQIVRLRVNPDDTDRAEAYRAEALRRKQAYPGQNQLTISAKTSGCLARGANPFQNVRLKTYLRRQANENFFVLLKETKLSFGGESGIDYCETGEGARPTFN